ncbi:MAG: hypothetical protein ACP5RE_03560, partial [Candidatus Acidifodinimicrobium sp.]
EIIENTAVVPSVVSPDVEGTVKALQQFRQLKTSVLSPEDTVTIDGKPFIKRSGWRKIALAFNITTEIVDIQHERLENDYIVHVRARAIAPNQRISEGIAACSKSEFTGKREKMGTTHNIEATASTRAINRAISDLVGGGEVSAEEIITEQETVQAPVQQAHPQTEKITDKQLSFLKQLMTSEGVKDFVTKELNGKSIENLTKGEASSLLDKIRNL